MKKTIYDFVEIKNPLFRTNDEFSENDSVFYVFGAKGERPTILEEKFNKVKELLNWLQMKYVGSIKKEFADMDSQFIKGEKLDSIVSNPTFQLYAENKKQINIKEHEFKEIKKDLFAFLRLFDHEMSYKMALINSLNKDLAGKVQLCLNALGENCSELEFELSGGYLVRCTIKRKYKERNEPRYIPKDILDCIIIDDAIVPGFAEKDVILIYKSGETFEYLKKYLAKRISIFSLDGKKNGNSRSAERKEIARFLNAAYNYLKENDVLGIFPIKRQTSKPVDKALKSSSIEIEAFLVDFFGVRDVISPESYKTYMGRDTGKLTL